MSIIQTDKIDFIGTDKASNSVILTISDHLDWNDSESHLLLLQEKLNSYLTFCESGEIYEVYPQARGNALIIEIVGEHPLSQEGSDFLEQVKEIIRENGNIELCFRHFTD